MIHRSYQENDIYRVRDLLRACYRSSHHPYSGIDLSNWERFCAMPKDWDNQQQFHIWEQEANIAQHDLVGIAQYQKKTSEVSCWGMSNDLGLFDEMYNWAIGFHKTYMEKYVESCALKASCCKSNTPQRII